jgi:hypothetical protein
MFFSIKNKILVLGLISLASFTQVSNATKITVERGGARAKVVSPEGQEPNISKEVSSDIPLTLEVNVNPEIVSELKNRGGLTTNDSKAVISLAHIIAKSWDPSSSNPLNFDFEDESGKVILEKAKLFLRKNLKNKLGSKETKTMLKNVLGNDDRLKKTATCLCFCSKGIIQALRRGGDKKELAMEILEVTKDSIFNALTGEANIIEMSSELTDIVFNKI